MVGRLFSRIKPFVVFIALITCCNPLQAKGPADSDILRIVESGLPGGFSGGGMGSLLLDMKIEKRGNARKLDSTTAYPITVRYKYIRGGFPYGYVSGCPEVHCCEDWQYETLREFLIYKNKWDEWAAFDSRTLEDKELEKIWRPASKSLKEFYSDRIQNLPPAKR